MFNLQLWRLRVTPPSDCNSAYEYVNATRSTIPQSVCVQLPPLPPLANPLDILGFADLGVFLLALEIMSNIRTNIGHLEIHSLASQQLAFRPKTMWILGLHLPIGRSVM